MRNGAPFVLHQWNKLGFWAHHLLGYCLVTIWGGTFLFYIVSRFRGDVPQAIVSSMIVLAIAWILITLVFELLSSNYRGKFGIDLRLLIAIAAGSAAAAAVAPVVNWVFGVMGAGLEVGTDRTDILAFMIERYPRVLIGMLFSVAPFWLVANWGWYAHREESGVYSNIGRSRAAGVPAAEPVLDAAGATVTAMPPAFMRKLPPAKRGVLWAITAEQHYLRIYTSAGDDLVLMRFSDALDELAGTRGLQVHRSHWVSAEGFRALSEDDKRLSITLQNGVVLPVSRPNYAAVKAAFSAPLLDSRTSEAETEEHSRTSVT